MGKEKEKPKSKPIKKWMTCPTCQGSGKMLTGQVCTHCHGVREIPYWTPEK